MKIAFHGAARTVTGSKHLLTLKSGKKVLMDCGMFQGLGIDTDVFNRDFGFNPEEVDVMILSHAHIDHCGLIPKLVKEGFNGKIFCTPATLELAKILLLDSAEIQEDDSGTVLMLENQRPCRVAHGADFFISLLRQHSGETSADQAIGDRDEDTRASPARRVASLFKAVRLGE